MIKIYHVAGQVASLIVTPLLHRWQGFDLANERRPIVATLTFGDFIPMPLQWITIGIAAIRFEGTRSGTCCRSTGGDRHLADLLVLAL